MISSRDEAMLVLNKWKSDSLLIQLVFNGAAGIGTGASMCVFGFILEVSNEKVLVSVGKPPSSLTMSIKFPDGVVFGYGDFREAATPEEQAVLSRKYVCALAIDFPSGDRCLFAELISE